MTISGNKKIICITGTAWTLGNDAPWNILITEGFVRPKWFTTDRPLSDASYYAISELDFHQAKAASKILVYTKYGNVFFGIMKSDFIEAMNQCEKGVLIVGFPEIISQIAEQFPQTKVFAFKPIGSNLSTHLDKASKNGQLFRIDIDEFVPDTYKLATDRINSIAGLYSQN